jgi:sugar lactone lactonase YvrE
MIRTATSAAALIVLAGCAPAPVEDVSWVIETVVGPSPFHGVHGLAVAPDGSLLAGSVVGQTIYRVNPDTGEISTVLGAPSGMADDLAFGPGGVLAWTGYLTGEVYVQEPDGEPRRVATGLPGANSLAFSPDGRLFVTQVFLADALHEVDWRGDGGARLIKSDLGGLNGFEFGPDGMIYGPLWFSGLIVKVDPADGRATQIASGFEIPAAANFGPDGMLYAIDTKTGDVKKIDPASGLVTTLARLKPSLDNLAIAPSGLIYVSNMADASIHEVHPITGGVRKVISGPLATPTDIALGTGSGGSEILHIADTFAWRTLNTATRELSAPLRMYRDELENPLGVSATKESGVVMLTSWAAGTVQLAAMTDAPDQGLSVGVIHGFQAPVDVLELADGRAVVLEAGAGSLRLLSQGDANAAASQTASLLASGLNVAVALAQAPDGAVWISEYAGGTLARLDLATGQLTRPITGLEGPEGIDFGSDGRIYVAETGARRVVAIDPMSLQKEILAEGLGIGLAAAPGALPSYTTTGIAVSDRDGSVYVASDLPNAILRIRKTGS